VGLSGDTPGFQGVNTFRGSISNSACGTFLLHRLAVAPDEAAAAGKWKGTYACAQGLSGLTLTIKPGKTVDTTMHTLTATFAFYPVAANPKVPSGSYSMNGYYFPGGIDLLPGQWISKPSFYGTYAVVALPPNGLALGDLPGVEQVELDFPRDVGDAGLAWLPGGEVAGLLGFPRAGAVRAVADEESGHEDFQQERGERVIWLVRGEKPRRSRSRRPGRAGS
jgi:hypothetical protein